jgi:predicted nucleotidyltransferase component of viral defense system
MTTNLAASVRARLLNVAQAQGSDFNQVLVRYALERFLYRLSLSVHSEQFVLKGALLFALWYDMPHRPTRDADLLGFGASDLATVQRTFQDIASIPVEDAIIFDAGSIAVQEIRKNAGYDGARVVISAELARARCKTQVDIGFGDAVTPGPVLATYPVLLSDMLAPRLRTYPTYTVVAEKLHAIALLGMANTRLKDYLDLSVLLSREVLDPDILNQAIAATFVRRGMAMPSQIPMGLTDEFAFDPTRQALWLAFLKKNQLPTVPLQEVVAQLRKKLWPAMSETAYDSRL